jgi:hypothetical protein
MSQEDGGIWLKDANKRFLKSIMVWILGIALLNMSKSI